MDFYERAIQRHEQGIADIEVETASLWEQMAAATEVEKCKSISRQIAFIAAQRERLEERCWELRREAFHAARAAQDACAA